MREAWDKFRKDIRKGVGDAVEDYHATNRKRAEKFSDKGIPQESAPEP